MTFSYNLIAEKMANLAQMGEFQRHTVSIDNAEWVRYKGGLASFNRYNEMINHYVGWEVRVNVLVFLLERGLFAAI